MCIIKKNIEILQIGKKITNRKKCHKRRYMNGQGTQEKMINIINTQRNKSLHCREILHYNLKLKRSSISYVG